MSIRQLQSEIGPGGATETRLAPSETPFPDRPAGAEFQVKVDGLNLRVRVDGTPGKPWIVFSNSLMTSLEIWNDQVAELAASFRILRYDQRGHGGSDVPQQPADFDRLADDLLELMDAFGIASATLVGISMGAVTVLAFALRNPGRVDRLVMADGQAATAPGGATAWQERIDLAQGKGMAGLIEPTLQRWFLPASIAGKESGVDLVGEMIASTPLEGFVFGARALQSFNYRPRLATLECPVLLIAGSGDRPLVETMRDMAPQIAGARFVEIPEAGHLPNVEQPSRFNAALVDFINRSGG